MAVKRTFFPLLAVWEICRFMFILMAFSRLFSSIPFPSGDAMIAVMLVANGNLLVPAGSLYLFFTKRESPPVLLLLGLGKLLGLVTVVLALVAAIVRFFAAAGNAAVAGGPFLEAAGLFIIFVLDLIFLVVLLSFKVEAERE